MCFFLTRVQLSTEYSVRAQAQEYMNGNWKLVYTSNSELMGLLAASRLPFVEIGDITQRVDTYSSTVENKVGVNDELPWFACEEAVLVSSH